MAPKCRQGFPVSQAARDKHPGDQHVQVQQSLDIHSPFSNQTLTETGCIVLQRLATEIWIEEDWWAQKTQDIEPA
jgi:hypothetical protein